MPIALSARRVAVAAVLALAAAVAMLAFTARSQAAETILWNNYSGDPDSIGYAAIDGTGGGALNLGAVDLDGPEGMAYDTVTNRLFVAGAGDNRIVAINLDGSGAADFTAPGAVVDSPQGLVIDPETRTVYWINTNTLTISWARLDGSAGGVVDTGGVKVDAYRLALDPVAKRLYWYDENASGEVRYTELTSVGGGALNIAGASATGSASGIAVEPGLGKVFWLNDDKDFLSWAYLNGSGGGDLAVVKGSYENSYGVAVDALLGRAYWANYGNGEARPAALGFANLAGGGAPLGIATAPVDGPQDPVVLKPPTASVAPAVTKGAGAGSSQLACSTGTWVADAAGAFVYQAPRSYGYQWTRDGAPIAGAIAASLTATEPGSYACSVTATNQAGATTATATAAASVAKAQLKVLVKTKKRNAKRKKKATFKVQYYNQGDLSSAKPRVCVLVPKKLRGALKAPKCKKLGAVTAKGRRTAKLPVFVKPAAKNKSYKLKFVVKGVPSKPSFGRVKVVGKS